MSSIASQGNMHPSLRSSSMWSHDCFPSGSLSHPDGVDREDTLLHILLKFSQVWHLHPKAFAFRQHLVVDDLQLIGCMTRVAFQHEPGLFTLEYPMLATLDIRS